MRALLALTALTAFGADAPAVRIGFGETRPYSYTGKDGRPSGFVVELFEDAAGREGIRLEWTRTSTTEANTRALADGTLHVMPMAVPLEERRRTLYVTDNWWTEDTILLVRGDTPRANAPAPRRLALPEVLSPDAAAHYRSARHVLTRSAPEALEQLCNGTADAALVGATYIRDLVNGRPTVCESVPLRIHESAAKAGFAIIANRGAEETARKLHRRIVEMTADGTLLTIAGRHPPISTPLASRMTADLRMRYTRQQMFVSLVALSVCLVLGVLALVHQFLSKRKLRAIIEQQRRTEQQLRESEAALRERSLELLRSNEDLQAFAYSASHDLQEPIRNQALYTELLDRRYNHLLPPAAKDILRVLQANALRAQSMMYSLLAYSRAGQPDRHRTTVDCATVVNRVVEDLLVQITAAGARIEVVTPLPAVCGWEDRLQQVFQNLIGNAIKYRRPQVAPIVTISAERVGDDWRFAVSDNGIGFKQAYADKVFKLFQRLHGTAFYDGSGIGLALSKRVIERHGGRIWAESREGEGSTFYFTVPAGQEPSETVVTRVPEVARTVSQNL